MSSLATAAEAARETSVTAGITLRLRVPTRLQMQRIVSKAGDFIAAQEPILLASIMGWSGVNASAIVPDMDGELPFSIDLITHVLDAYPTAADAAYNKVIDEFAKRREKTEAASKN
jgi:hypothetical protein